MMVLNQRILTRILIRILICVCYSVLETLFLVLHDHYSEFFVKTM